VIVCGTGHRPEKIGGYSYSAFRKLVDFAKPHLENHNPDEVISGTALGWDMVLLVAGLELGMNVHAAIPFNTFGSQWGLETKRWWNDYIEQCSTVTIVTDLDDEPKRFEVLNALNTRNKFMVDKSNRVMALWNGTSGGTANTVHYAESVRRTVDNYWYFWERYG